MADNLDNDFLDDLEYEEAAESVTGPDLAGVQELSGPAAAARLQRGDKYRLPYINPLDVVGWVGIFIVLWLVYTMVTGVYGYVTSFGTPATQQNIAEMQLKREKQKRVRERKKQLRVEQKVRRENDQALIAISERLNAFDPDAQIVEEEEEVLEEEPEDKKRQFSLGRAISNLLLKDLSKAKKERERNQ